VIGSAGDIDYLLVKQAENYSGFTLVSDSGKRSIILFNLIAWIAQLAQLVRAHRVDKPR